MSGITIYHNHRCGTSRNVLALIKNTGSRLLAINAAAACVASKSDTDLPSMKQAFCGMHPAGP